MPPVQRSEVAPISTATFVVIESRKLAVPAGACAGEPAAPTVSATSDAATTTPIAT